MSILWTLPQNDHFVVLALKGLKKVYQKLRLIKSTTQEVQRITTGNGAAFYKFLYLLNEKDKKINKKNFENSLGYENLYFHQLFNTKFELQETWKLPP